MMSDPRLDEAEASDGLVCDDMDFLEQSEGTTVPDPEEEEPKQDS